MPGLRTLEGFAQNATRWQFRQEAAAPARRTSVLRWRRGIAPLAVVAFRRPQPPAPAARRFAARGRPARRARGSRDRAAGAPSATDWRALRVPRGYRPAVAVFGRSSIRTWLNSVLSLCAPHWGQRSADDQAPHRWHALWVRFGTISLPVHRCRIFHSIIGQFHPNWKPHVSGRAARRRFAGSGRRQWRRTACAPGGR